MPLAFQDLRSLHRWEVRGRDFHLGEPPEIESEDTFSMPFGFAPIRYIPLACLLESVSVPLFVVKRVVINVAVLCPYPSPQSPRSQSAISAKESLILGLETPGLMMLNTQLFYLVNVPNLEPDIQREEAIANISTSEGSRWRESQYSKQNTYLIRWSSSIDILAKAFDS